MNRLSHYLVDRKTKGSFRADEIPSVYGVVECYRRFQKREFGRDLSFRKALNEFHQYVFLPVKKEIEDEGIDKDDFYPAFMQKTFTLFGKNRKAAKESRVVNPA